MNTSELLDANLHGIFGNRDATTRRATAESAYAPDVVFLDPEGRLEGRDAVLEKAAALLEGAPETFVFAEDGHRYVSDGTGALPWAFGPEGEPVVRGIDVITVHDGVISSITTILLEGQTT
ncbi:nuclear transport factor 2 family protein [Rathayibacter sp. YIM 133350]|uniref:nuclear transport factor 2 family protein n=1 Tax=Rathayibacter sp. YIM 133350 TaxID=3131992 RepID=UPI00307D27FA